MTTPTTRRSWPMAHGSWMGATLLGFLIACSHADEPAQKGVSLTIYNQNFATVRDKRAITLKKGTQELLFRDVAATIDPTSVKFESMTDADGTKVLEQNYQYDLVDKEKLLQKYIDREIAFEVTNEKDKSLERKSGTLLSTNGIVKMDGEIRLNFPGSVILPALPEGLITRPTLAWLIDAKRAGEHTVKVAYQAANVSWIADYTLVARKDDTLGDLGGWVTINNRSGATYTDAAIKLIAGDVHRVQPVMRQRVFSFGDGEESGGGFVEKSFAEYHLYALGRPSTVKESEVKQIELLTKTNVPMKKIYRYDAGRDAKKVQVLLQIQNREDNRLGIPLPAGKVRVYKEDEADGSLEFVGEDRIDHTPKDEKLDLYIGDAFDFVGERIQTDNKQHPRHHWQSFKITLKNHKETPATIEAVEHVGSWGNWEVEKKTAEFVKKDAGTIVFTVEVPKNGEKVIEYTLHSWWE